MNLNWSIRRSYINEIAEIPSSHLKIELWVSDFRRQKNLPGLAGLALRQEGGGRGGLGSHRRYLGLGREQVHQGAEHGTMWNAGAEKVAQPRWFLYDLCIYNIYYIWKLISMDIYIYTYSIIQSSSIDCLPKCHGFAYLCIGNITASLWRCRWKWTTSPMTILRYWSKSKS